MENNNDKSQDKKILNEIELSSTIKEIEKNDLYYDLLYKEKFIDKLKRYQENIINII